MGVLKATIGGADVSQYLKYLLVTPGGDGRPGKGILTLDKQAAGLDIRPMMVVNVWETWDAAGAGVADRGRLFGGLVRNRDTSNIGTTKTWQLSCDDFNIIGTRGLVRDMEASAAITLTAGTFAAQVTQLTEIIQRNSALSVHTEINTTDAVSDLYATMPGVTYEGGHTYFWYLGMLCAKAVELDTALRPTYFLSTSITVGGSETFGPPTLYLFDKVAAAANPPAFVFSDNPGVGEHPMYLFKRKSASNEIVQRQQIRTPAQVLTGYNTAAQAAYPNPYMNHGGTGNTGAWMGEPIVKPTVTDLTAAQALIDRKVESAGYARDSYLLRTDQRLRNGEYVSVTNSLEGLSDVVLQVVETEYTVDPTLEVWVDATLNARRLRLGETAEDDIYAPPVEGDTVPPLPPENFALVSNVFNPATGMADLTFDWDPSPSADTALYQILAYASGGYSPVWEGDLDTTEATIQWEAGAAYEVRARAVDSTGNEGHMTDPALTGTAAVFVHAELPNPSFEFVDRTDLTKPRYWTRVLTAGGTAVVDDTVQVHGLRSLKLATAGGATDAAAVLSDLFMAEGLDEHYYAMSLSAKASVSGETLEWQITQYLADGTPDTARARSGSFTLTTDMAEYIEPMILMYGDAPNMKLRLGFAATTARTVHVDGVSLKPKPRVTVRKNAGPAIGTRGQINLIEGPGIQITIEEDVPNGEIDVTIETLSNPSSGAVGGWRDEFLPAAAATVITLTYEPTRLMTVARNGLEQSIRAGHFTWSGDQLTFSTAFDGTEELVVSYLIGGVTPVSPPTIVVSAVGTGKTLSLWNGTSNDAPPADWETAGFDDTAWNATGAGSAGSVVVSGAARIWDTGGLASAGEAVLHRHSFSLPSGVVTTAVLSVAIDDVLDAFYINGQNVLPGLVTGPDILRTYNVPQALLLPGASNQIAVKFRDTFGSGYDLQYRLEVG